jgi:hypothetical protein
VSSDESPYICDGGSWTISMDSQNIVLRSKGVLNKLEERIPLDRIGSVIVQRKSVMPFITLAMLAAVVGTIVKYNSIWFLVDLTADISSKGSVVAFLIALLCAVPAMSRILFVNVVITSTGSETWRVRFVTAKSGLRLASKFQELAARSHTDVT